MTAPKWYDITVSKEKIEKTMTELGQILENQGADRYVIGDEVGEGGYKHYQVRVVYKTEHTMDWMIKVWGPVGHVSASHVRDFKYCEKEGNFFRSWEKALNKYAEIDLLPWQKTVLRHFEEQDDRRVLVIIDVAGGAGKTTLSKYCQITRKACYVPPMGDSQDLMAFAMAKPSRGYIFDMPRTESIKQRKGMWSAVEQIKNGYLYDKRYNYRDMWIEPPKVIIFTNEEPPEDALSQDRWEIIHLEKMGDSIVTQEW